MACLHEHQSVYSTAGLTYVVSSFIIEEAIVVHSAIQPVQGGKCVCVCVCVGGGGGGGGGERDMTVNVSKGITVSPPNLRRNNTGRISTYMNESMRSPFGFSRTKYRPHSSPSNSSASSRCINPWYSVLYSEGHVSSCV